MASLTTEKKHFKYSPINITAARTISQNSVTLERHILFKLLEQDAAHAKAKSIFDFDFDFTADYHSTAFFNSIRS